MTLVLVALVALGTLPFALWPLLSRRAAGDAPEAAQDDRAALAGSAAAAGAISATPVEVAGPSRLGTLRALYRDRRAELEQEAAAGVLGADDLAQALAELDRSALRELEAEAASVGAGRASSASGQVPRSGVVALAAIALLAVVGGYLALGEPAASELAGAGEILGLPESATAELKAWQSRLEARVEQRPGEAKSHYLLGHVALKQQRFDVAANAFAQASMANGQPDPGIDLYWLQARFLNADAALDAQSQAIAQRILEQAPNQPAVLEILAIDALGSGRFAEAVSVLNRALSQPLGAEQRAALEAGLEQARAQLPATPAAVDVAIALDSEIPSGATLFVIARPVGGGMPFAVVRRPGPDYPSAVRLDDSVSMNPARPLSVAQSFEVVVRLSLSGRPQRQPGDWEWQSEALNLGGAAEPVELRATLGPPAA